MEDWVRRALAKWPDVPALFGWLRLDRRGRWLVRDEPVSRPQIIDTICANYAGDPCGRWFFQNGPQRGYVALDYAPLVLRVEGDGRLLTHCRQPVARPGAAFLDEHGSLLINTEHGPGLLQDQDLEWALTRMRHDGEPVTEADVATALALPSHAATALTLHIDGEALPLRRLDAAEMPGQLGFVREPQADPPSEGGADGGGGAVEPAAP